MDPFWVFGPTFVNPCVVPFWLTLGSTIGGGIVTTIVDVHPTWRCTSICGVVLVGLGRRWRLSRRCLSPKKRSFYFLFSLFKGVKNCAVFF